LPFADEVAALGERSAIGQLVLRLTSPGVPDIYGGDELWFLTLVDPDNRQPVDWLKRRNSLAALATGTQPLQHETVKLHVIREALALRGRRPEAFAGAYDPRPAPASTCAYRRGDDVLVAVPVRGNEPEVDLPPGDWTNVLEGVDRVLGGYRPEVWERI
jgi:(1->4)-alpha-D-glucan 1-alpha-D-glucosylmutase